MSGRGYGLSNAAEAAARYRDRRHPRALLQRHYAVHEHAPFRAPGPSVSDSALVRTRFLGLAVTAVLCYVAQCSQVRADVVGVGDAELGVERQGVLPVLAGQAVLACGVARVSDTGVGAGLLVPVTGLDGQSERGRVLGARLLRLARGLAGFPPAAGGLRF